MNTAPSRAIFDGIFRGKAPGLSEFGALLQFIPTPAVLAIHPERIDRRGQQRCTQINCFFTTRSSGKAIRGLVQQTDQPDFQQRAETIS